MKKYNILLIYPSKEIHDKYEKNENVIFLDKNNWSYFHNKKRVNVSIDEIVDEREISKNFNPRTIINILRSKGPLWSRWTDRGDQTELYLRKSLFEIFSLSCGIKKFKITKAIFPTSISHHIDTSILEIACMISDVRQIFPYSLTLDSNKNIYGRLLPLVQIANIKDRKVISEKISEYEYNDDLNNVFSIARENKFNLKDYTMFSKSHSLSKIVLYCKYIKSRLGDLGRFLFPKLDKRRQVIGVFPDYKLKTIFKQIKQQKEGIKYYKKNISSPNSFETKKAEDNILIVAHHQPEATSFPEGAEMHNHIDIVFELRRKGFRGNIFYKEHPACFLYYESYVGSLRVGQYRSVEYYKQLKRLGCIFLDTSYELSFNKNSNFWYVPITVTGSIALERSLSGYNTIISGYPWFKGLPGLIHIDDVESFDLLKDSWKKHNQELSISAKKYLINMLNNKTIFNAWGVGTGLKTKDYNLKKSFMGEYDNLINFLIENKNV